jgi:predicted amidohydrolase
LSFAFRREDHELAGMRCARLPLALLSLSVLALPPVTLAGSAMEKPTAVLHPHAYQTRADSLPRKVVVATAVVRIGGPLTDRLHQVSQLLDDAARQAASQHPGHGLDLVLFPEFALARDGATAAEQAVTLAGPIQDSIGAKARELHTWIVLPMTLREPKRNNRISNAAVLFNREGAVAGVFRKVHPIVDSPGVFEGGVTPGDDYPVFTTDFGRLGILICWDMCYEEAWDALAGSGAEIVALPTASPQNSQPMAQALRHHYYVVNSAPRDNASVFDPLGRVAAQRTTEGMLVHQIDLAYAILHWSEPLRNGQALTDRFGDRVSHTYTEREDTGLFWSNDPKLGIGDMLRELGLREMYVTVQRVEAERVKARALNP